MLPSERTNFPSPSRPPPPPSQDRPTHPDQPEPRSPHGAGARSGRGRTGAARATGPRPTTPAERAWACAARAPHPRHPPTGRRTGNPSRRASAARRARIRASRRVRRWEERGVCVIACSQSPPRGPLCAHPRPTTTPTPRLYPQRHPTSRSERRSGPVCHFAPSAVARSPASVRRCAPARMSLAHTPSRSGPYAARPCAPFGPRAACGPGTFRGAWAGCSYAPRVVAPLDRATRRETRPGDTPGRAWGKLSELQ